MSIYYKQFDTKENEINSIAEIIKSLEEQNYPLTEIAVLARKNSDLTFIAQIMKQYEIPVSYDKIESVLEKEHIQWIIKILQFVNTVCQKSQEEADWLLPEILSYPFWELDRLTIYKISLKVWEKRKTQKNFKKQNDNQELEAIQKITWLSTMLEWTEDKKVPEIASFLIDLAFSKISSAEKLIDRILGVENFQENRSETMDFEELD